MEKSRSRVTAECEDLNELLVGPPDKQVVKIGFSNDIGRLQSGSPIDKDIDLFSNHDDSIPEMLMDDRQI